MRPVDPEITRLESEIMALKKQLAEYRRSLPPQVIANFSFDGPDGPVRLSELFGESDDLVLVHNMGRTCAYCTLWADGFNGAVPELESRAGFVLVSADPIEVLAPFARERGWRFKWVASPEPAFRREIGMVGPDDSPWPGGVGLRKMPSGEIHIVATAEFGDGDNFCSTWHLFDLLKDGANDWSPAYRL